MAHKHDVPCEHCKAMYEEMRKLAYSDHLTGLPNRRAFDGALEYEIARAHRKHRLLSLAIIDVDHFKKVNDVYGHQVGDQVLVKLGQILKKMYRVSDFIARLGGEEFGIILPGAILNDAPVYLERLRITIERELIFHIGDAKIATTASLGVVEIEAGDDAHTMYARADTALYAAKANGRNQVFSIPVLA